MVQKQNAPHAALFLLVALVARAASAIPDGETLETKMLCLSKTLFQLLINEKMAIIGLQSLWLLLNRTPNICFSQIGF
jgi:hypothetical protein